MNLKVSTRDGVRTYSVQKRIGRSKLVTVASVAPDSADPAERRAVVVAMLRKQGAPGERDGS